MYQQRNATSWTIHDKHTLNVTPSQNVKPERGARNVFSHFLSSSTSPRPMHVLPKSHTLYNDPAFSPDPQSHPFFATSHNAWAASSTAVLKRQKPSLSIHTAIQDTEELPQPPKTPMHSDDHSTITSHETTSSWNTSASSSTSLSSAPTSHDSYPSKWAALPPQPTQPLPWPPEKKKKQISMFWRKSPPETPLEPVDRSPKNRPEPPSYETILLNRPKVARISTAPELESSTKRPAPPPRSTTVAVDSKPPPTASRRIISGHTIHGHELDRIDELDESNPLGLPLHHGGPYEVVHKSVKQDPAKENIPHHAENQYEHKIPSHLPKQDAFGKLRRHKPSDSTPISQVPGGVSLNLAPGQILPHNFQYQAYLGQTQAQSPPWFEVPNHQSQTTESRTRTQQDPYRWQDNAPLWQQEMYDSSGSLLYDTLATQPDGGQRSGRPKSMLVGLSATATDDITSKRNRRSSTPQILPLFPEFSTENQVVYNPQLPQAYPEDLKRAIRQSVSESQAYTGNLYSKQSHIDRSSSAAQRSTQSSARLPPRMQALRRDKAVQNSRPVDEPPRHSQRAFYGLQEAGGLSIDNIMQNGQPVDEPQRQPQRKPTRIQELDGIPLENRPHRTHIPLEQKHQRKSQGTGQTNYTASIETDHSLPFPTNNYASTPSNIIQPTFEFAQDTSTPDHLQHPQQQRASNEDTRSSQQSVTNNNPSHLDNPRNLPLPHHVPKRLVMPAPLQSSHPIASRYQPESHHPPLPTNALGWPPRTRSPSMPLYGSGQQGRSPDIPVLPNRKLRKRSSIQGAPVPVTFAQTPASFESTVGYPNIHSSQPIPSKAEKAPKKVLSKRRTGF